MAQLTGKKRRVIFTCMHAYSAPHSTLEHEHGTKEGRPCKKNWFATGPDEHFGLQPGNLCNGRA